MIMAPGMAAFPTDPATAKTLPANLLSILFCKSVLKEMDAQIMQQPNKNIIARKRNSKTVWFPLKKAAET